MPFWKTLFRSESGRLPAIVAGGIAGMLLLAGLVAPAPNRVEPAPAPEPEPAVETVIVPPPSEPIMPPPRMVSPEALFSDLREGFDPDIWLASAQLNEHAGTHYGGPWKPENIVQNEGYLSLLIKAGIDGARPTMAELKSKQDYGFGRYEVIMRPSGEQGTVSAFFSYTGPWAGDPHDEIDIEFVGKRRQHVEFNHWIDGKSAAPDRVKLEFDASKSLNLYAYEWRADEIVWFINGEEAYRTPRGATNIPTHPGRVFISAWAGTERMRSWIGAPKYGDTAQADFACASFTPFGDESYTCSDLWAEDPQFAGPMN
jgi:endo-1,3-1,4-beta-glycanase ExoK